MQRSLCTATVAVLFLAALFAWPAHADPKDPPPIWIVPLQPFAPTAEYVSRNPAPKPIDAAGRSMGVFKVSGGGLELWVVVDKPGDPLDERIVKVGVEPALAREIVMGELVLVHAMVSDTLPLDGEVIELMDGLVMPI